MFMIVLFESAFYNSIEMSMYRNNFLDLQKNSLKRSFNFKKRVGESHVLLHNLRVELFKYKHKMAFAGEYRSLFFAETLQQCSLIYKEPVTPPAKKYKNLSNPYYDIQSCAISIRQSRILFFYPIENFKASVQFKLIYFIQIKR